MRYRITVLLAAAILLLSLASFFLPFGADSDKSENRTMAEFDMVLDPDPGSVVYSDSPVERLDAALSDQFPLRKHFVQSYLWTTNASANLMSGLARRLHPLAEDQLALRVIGDYELIGDTDYLTEFPPTEELDAGVTESRRDQLEKLHGLFPDLKAYVYFVSQAYDTGWFDEFIGRKTADHYAQISESLPEWVRTGRLLYQDPEDYMNVHYKTDHHWNHRGARRGYEDIHGMMQADFDLGPLREPEAENTVSETFGFVYLGSYGRALRGLYRGGYDSFSFWEYGLPERTAAILDPETLEETEAETVGLIGEYREGEVNGRVGADHYSLMYGTAVDREGNRYSDSDRPFLLRCGGESGRNLLICGDSYARAVRDVLASHFNTAVYLDYRLFATVPVDELVEKYEIDTLLICCRGKTWNNGNYLFTFGGEE